MNINTIHQNNNALRMFAFNFHSKCPRADVGNEQELTHLASFLVILTPPCRLSKYFYEQDCKLRNKVDTL